MSDEKITVTVSVDAFDIPNDPDNQAVRIRSTQLDREKVVVVPRDRVKSIIAMVAAKVDENLKAAGYEK